MGSLLLLTLLALVPRPSEAAVALTLNKETTVRVTSAAVQGSDGAAFPGRRFFYIRESTEVFSATSVDGLDFTEEAGVRLSSLTVPLVDVAVTSITGLSLLPLDAGGFRMAYAVTGTTGAFNIYTATSADGLAWANDTGTAIVGGATFNGYPSLVELDSAIWAMFFVRNAVAGNDPTQYRVFRATSANEGRNWSVVDSPLPTQAVSGVAASKLTDGKVRLWLTAPLSGSSSSTVVLSALSADANAQTFSLETGVRLSTSPGTVFSPYVERTTDTFRWRLYYDYSPVGVSTGDVFSAVTDAPQPGTISPSTVLTNLGSSPSTITGEIFDTVITATLRQNGTILPGAGLVRADDQTLTATFATQNQPTGLYDLILTNSNGLSTTMANAVLIDFPGGSVTLTDNLLRPRSGGVMRADITTFSAGRVTAKLYTLDGRPVSTIFDQDVPIGTVTATWNATTASGATVASGVYLLNVKGPKLNAVDKIVVIK